MQKIIILGDVAFSGVLSYQPEKNIKRFKTIKQVLKHRDMVIANLEVPLKADESRNEHKKFIHYSLYEPTSELLSLMNIGCVSLANNHIYDCKMPGLKATIEMLDSKGILHTGAGWLPEHVAPVIFDLNGQKIGFIAYVDSSTNPETHHFPELLINSFDPEIVRQEIINLKKRTDKIILSLHWGNDYSFYPTPQQIKIARSLVDAGADIIMGHHPHTLQPFEKHNSGFIFYSLGGVTFGDYVKEGKTSLQALFRKTKKGLIVQFDAKLSNPMFTSTLERKGNFITIIKRDYAVWSKKIWCLYRIKYSSKISKGIFEFKERILDRVYEYFFGYYQNPFKRLFQFKNIRKVSRLFTDFKSNIK